MGLLAYWCGRGEDVRRVREERPVDLLLVCRLSNRELCASSMALECYARLSSRLDRQTPELFSYPRKEEYLDSDTDRRSTIANVYTCPSSARLGQPVKQRLGRDELTLVELWAPSGLRSLLYNLT